MTFISYAQNFEDVILWRALKQIHNGFYVDVGAFSANNDSVTKAFYERGWRGINVEPNPAFTPEYRAHRPFDINLSIALADKTGRQNLYLSSNAGLNSLDPDIALSHLSLTSLAPRIEVDVSTLAEILQLHRPIGDIHFLKIDVEGLEESVLRGNDWQRFRPWIVLLEARIPMSQVENYIKWEPYLIGQGYFFAYDDGLNRFYVSIEKRELITILKFPPNVFDDFITGNEKELQLRIDSLSRDLNELELKQQESQMKTQEAATRLDEFESKIILTEKNLSEALDICRTVSKEADIYRSMLAQIQGSKSWYFTAPLRLLSQQIRLLHSQGFAARARAASRKINHFFYPRNIYRNSRRAAGNGRDIFKKTLKSIIRWSLKFKCARAALPKILPEVVMKKILRIIHIEDCGKAPNLNTLPDFAIAVVYDLLRMRKS